MTCSSLAGGVGVSSVGWSGVIGFGAVLVMKRSSPVLRGALLDRQNCQKIYFKFFGH